VGRVIGAVVRPVIGTVIGGVIRAVIGAVIGTVIGVVVAAGQHQGTARTVKINSKVFSFFPPYSLTSCWPGLFTSYESGGSHNRGGADTSGIGVSCTHADAPVLRDDVQGLEDVLAGESRPSRGRGVRGRRIRRLLRRHDALLPRQSVAPVGQRVVLLLSEFPARPPRPSTRGRAGSPGRSCSAGPYDRSRRHGARFRHHPLLISRPEDEGTRSSTGSARRRRRPDVDAKSPEVRIVVRIVRDECAVSLDTSGESLNRRGTGRTRRGVAERNAGRGASSARRVAGDEPLVDRRAAPGRSRSRRR